MSRSREECLADLSLVCANFGNGAVLRDVLSDWFEFVGGRPGEVVIVDGGSDRATQRACWDAMADGLVDKLQLIAPGHPDNDRDRCFVQEYAAGALATRPYILFFKTDTLPYRAGHEDWLVGAMEQLERPDVFAVGGSFNEGSLHHEAMTGWYFSDKCSENFALMKAERFGAAMREFAGAFIDSGFRGVNPGAATGQARYLVEVAFERHIERHRRYTLVRREDESWTVFHTNCRDGDLAEARRRFRARDGVGEYLDAGSGRFGSESRYYGLPRPPLSKRVRMAFGRTFLGPWWRSIKSGLPPARRKS